MLQLASAGFYQKSSTLAKVWLLCCPTVHVVSVQLLHKRPKTWNRKKKIMWPWHANAAARLQKGAKLFKVAELWMWKMTSRDEKAFSLTGPLCTFRTMFFLFF